MPLSLTPALEALVAERYADLVARCRAAGVPLHDDAGVAQRVRRTLLASDFAWDAWRRDPALLSPSALDWLRAPGDAGARATALPLAGLDETAQRSALRRLRRAEALRLVFRDVNDFDDLPGTLAATNALYVGLIEAALAAAERMLAQRHGVVRDATGEPQRLLVLGLGKLGGGELNFSSDVDLILAYAEDGASDGTRPLEAGEYYARLGQRMVGLLADTSADGQVARVDLRLRPFGAAGRLAQSFAAMEQYYQRDGRDWERYAWIKAWPVAGDLGAGRRLLAQLRPFVYRRYFDYTAFAGLRAMKALIDAEVARKDLTENLKLGPGGIREIEFLVQLEQLIRGGREPALRVPGLLPALAALESRGRMGVARARRLREAYLFLRRLENRLQMLRDQQTHDVPASAQDRLRLALTLGYPDWAPLADALAAHRAAVAGEFAAVLLPGGAQRPPSAGIGAALWRAAQDGSLDAAMLQAAGFADPEAGAALAALPASATLRAMSADARARLERVLPALLDAAQASTAPSAALERLLRLLQSIARRAAYLALLEEAPAARRRLADLFARSAFLAERVIAQPLLLDDVLDPRIERLPLRRAEISAEIGAALAALDERDAEGELERLNELKASFAFRLGLAFSDERADAIATARRLAALAEAVIAAVLTLAERELVARHGRPPGSGSGFAVLGYGSLGGEELGFASDLDLVFVYDGARAALGSDGARPLEGATWYQRLAQRVVHWLTVLTPAGRLYEVDTRLRPDGSKGLLVLNLEAFATYQRERAWTWEHQALLRARPLGGDAALAAALARLRREVLARPRDAATVRAEVAAMRARWRVERDRSDAAHLDLKQGAGALLDIEFLLQGLLLVHATAHPLLLEATSTPAQIAACRGAGLLDGNDAATLGAAHAVLLQRALACTLDARPRRVPRDAELAAVCAGVLRIAAGCGFEFATVT